MKLVRSFFAAIVFSALLSSAHAATRILPLGDSITHGETGHNPYRRSLWRMLVNSGYDVDFVGSIDTAYNPSGPPPLEDFDKDHEGHAGFRADEILAALTGPAGYLSGYTPDIVLLHIGSNDALQNHGGASFLANTRADIVGIIAALRADNPSVKILLAQIIPLDPVTETIPEAVDPDTVPRINSLNLEILDIASDLTTVASPIIVVDQHTGFLPAVGQDTYDGVHPNDSGVAKMAAKWFQALESVLPVAPRSFYRAINVGGPATVIDGNSWDGDGVAVFTANGTPFTYPDILFPFDPNTYNPAVDTAHKDMLRTFRFETQLLFEVSNVPPGDYDVYVWTFEDTAPSLTASLSMEGAVVEPDFTSGSPGDWIRLGPFRVTVNDGVLNVDFLCTNMDLAIISGLELWRVGLLPPVGTFYRGINVGGQAVVIDNNQWEADQAPNNNFTVAGSLNAFTFSEPTSFTFDPAVGPAHSEMLRSIRGGADMQYNMSNVPPGTFDVYVWTFEDNVPLTGELSVEGQVVEPAFLSVAAGKWDRLGPFEVVSDGNISIRFRCTGNDLVIVSGIEVWQTAAPPPPPPGSLYRAINVGGNSVVINGETWEADLAPNNGFTVAGSLNAFTFSEPTSFTFDPAVVDPMQSEMLRSIRGGADLQLTMHNVPPGAFDVYVYTFEDNLQLTADLSVEGAVVLPGYASGPNPGKWDRLGPFTVVSDGAINVRFQCTVNDLVIISGLEVRYAGTPPPPPPEGTFYRAINVGGPSIIIDGNNWEADGAVGFTANGASFTYPDPNNVFPFDPDTFNPAVDPAHKDMLRDFRFDGNLLLSLTGKDAGGSVPVPHGTYDVYIWTFEDTAPPLAASLSVEGVAVEPNFASGAIGDWNRLGPYRVLVEDGDIDVQFQCTDGNQVIISGLEVWQIALTPVPGSLYRAINVGGNAVVINGEQWEADLAPNNGFTVAGSLNAFTFSEPTSFTFDPAVVDPMQSEMLRSIRGGADLQLTMHNVPAGTYNVYVYTFEDNIQLTANLSVEGAVVLPGYTSGPNPGKWDQLGPFPVVSDGAINVRFQCTGNDLVIISGLEVRHGP